MELFHPSEIHVFLGPTLWDTFTNLLRWPFRLGLAAIMAQGPKFLSKTSDEQSLQNRQKKEFICRVWTIIAIAHSGMLGGLPQKRMCVMWEFVHHHFHVAYSTLQRVITCANLTQICGCVSFHPKLHPWAKGLSVLVKRIMKYRILSIKYIHGFVTSWPQTTQYFGIAVILYPKRRGGLDREPPSLIG